MFEGMESVDDAHYAVIGVEDHEVAHRLCGIHRFPVSDVVVALVIDHQVHVNVVSLFEDLTVVHRGNNTWDWSLSIHMVLESEGVLWLWDWPL